MPAAQALDLDALKPVLWLLAQGWGLAAVVMLVLWALQLRSRNATAVDIAWAANLGLLAIGYAWLAEEQPAQRRWLLAVLVGLWSARLALHLARHRLGSNGEDGRYRFRRPPRTGQADLRRVRLSAASALRLEPSHKQSGERSRSGILVSARKNSIRAD